MLAAHRMLPDNIPDQLIAAGIGPVGKKFSIYKIVADGPRIINIFVTAKDKTVIHLLHFLHLVYALAHQGILYLLLCEAKTVTVFITGYCSYFYIIQV